jgi:hypothetical protein
MQDKKQFGPIIVSVTDDIFDHDNEKYVDVANKIEILPVGHGWLRTFKQLIRAP